MKSNLQNSMIQLQDIDSKLQTLGIPEKVELPEGFIQKMTQIESELYTWNSWENANNDKIKIEKIINTKQQEINGVSNYLNMINAYINLTGPTGLIYKEIMEKLTKSFNDTLVNYEISQYEFRKKTHLTLMPQYFNNGNWISYNACSGGQKTILDIHFLSKILSKTGLLIFDEFLKHLSPSNHELCIDLISNMDVGCTIISSHMESIQAFNNRTCTLNLTDGITNIDID
jgi:DNA repair exonuclease SbcCD ATPase subunit